MAAAVLVIALLAGNGPSRRLCDEMAEASLPRPPFPVALAPAGEVEEAPEEEEEDKWEFVLEGYWTNPPDDDAYFTGILRADRGPLHLEGRYNYEDYDTGSVFAGWTFAWEGEVEFYLVPMMGFVFGHAKGAVPGLELDLTWKCLNLYAEAEYVFDSRGKEDSFFFLWTELTATPVKWLTFGLVLQHTQEYEIDEVLDWGPMVGFNVGPATAMLYVFNPGKGDSFLMVGVTWTF